MGTVQELMRRNPADVERLLGVWESSVRETHDFLTQADIVALRPEVLCGLRQVKRLYVCYDDNGAMAGFAGAAGGKLEMLFVRADARGGGLGKALLRHVVDNAGVSEVDVNEQNVQGVGFYRHMGFEQTGRSALDEQGRPFPILHMRRKG